MDGGYALQIKTLTMNEWTYYIELYTKYYKVYDLSRLNLPLSDVIEIGLETAINKLHSSLKRHKLYQFKKRSRVSRTIFIKSKPTMLRFK